ncbi:MAG: ATP synthase F1 subunit gamma [Puniceicoccaceae bacterium]|nr:ATP synthase F1 subunit gamma [Puniceicoccaceae bacterium]|tara:strand:+ start:317 stop:1207 length:891 start_codon:yes stop_codon:yes gene_type:complete
MANLRDIRRRIKSVKNTRQITRAMQLVSSSKMKRAQDSALAGRPYAFILAQMLNTVSQAFQSSGADIEHPFFQKRAVKRRGILVLSTDKGLCGPLNTNLFRLVSEQVDGEASFFTVGKKGAQYVAREGLDLAGAYEISDKAETAEVAPLVDSALTAFKAGHIDTLEIAYPSFVNVLVQVPVILPILPILDLETMLAQLRKKIKGDSELVFDESRAIAFEPSAADILASLPERYVEFMLYQMILESRASEYSARMVAMKSATDNASKLVDSLTLDYNKARQAAITQEILEIAAASAA